MKNINATSLQICQNIKAARVLTGLNQTEFAELLGIKRTTYAEYERKIEPDLEMLTRIAAAAKVNLSDIIGTSSQNDEKFISYQEERQFKKIVGDPDIPVFTGNTRAGTIEIYTDDPSQQTPIGHLSAKVFPGCNHAEKVNGDSMYPLICNQAYVVGKIIDKRGIIWGEKYIIHTIHGQSVVKFIHPSKQKDCIKIVSHNKSIPEQDIPMDDINFCCRVHFIVNPS